jgi:uncharacterized membrane protein
VTKRNASIDLLRGVVMVIMALDHARDFFGQTPYEPTDLDHTNAPLFFTRWITHYCAPVFVFLAGTAAWLSRGKKSDSELTRFLLSRGAWLIFLEITVNNFFWSFRPPLVSFVILQVIWAIGASMIVLACVARLPAKIIAILGGVIVVGHDMLDHVHPFPKGGLHVLWCFFHESDFGLAVGPFHFGVVYPLVPWIGVMMLGFAFGSRFAATRSVDDRSRETLRLGLTITLLFLAVRASNIYGDPTPWTARGGIGTLLSFLDVGKYPPSLCYLLMTLGPALVLLALFDRSRVGETNPLAKALVVYGRVPLFYYLLHVLVIHTTSNIVFLIERHAWRVGWNGDNRLNVGLPLTYLAWIAIVVALYFPCRWFANVKASAWGREQRWLSYL